MTNPYNNPNIPEERYRITIRDVLGYEWRFFFRNRIPDLIKQLEPFINPASHKKLTDSFNTIESLIMSLISDEVYLKEEKSTDFRRLIIELDNVMKDFFEAFNLEEQTSLQNDQNEEKDSISISTLEMYSTIRNLRNCHERLEYIYPSINWLIQSLRNSYTHQRTIARTAHRKHLKSLDSIFPLVSIVILSLYSYVELLDLWVNTRKQFKKRNNNSNN